MHLTNVLPEEILLEIFSEIDKSELRKFLEISSEWRTLLIKNVKVMRKLPLILIGDTWPEKLNFVEKYGKFIREVIFENATIDSFEDVAKVLRLTPNIEKLSLINLSVKENENPESDESKDLNTEDEERQKVFMKNLREISVCGVGSLEFIASQLIVQMTSLKCELIDDANRSTLEQLMTENRELRSLEVCSSLDEIFNPSEEVFEGFSCRLERILVRSTVLRYDEQFVKFLKSQMHLKEIGMIAGFVDFRYHQMMFTTFPSLRRIQLNIDAMGTNDCLSKLQKIPPNPSIESLTVFGQNIHLNIFEALLKLSPKLHRLSIENMTHFYSDKITELPLTQLRVDRAKKDFVNLEQLTQSTKVFLIEVVSSQKETYERNLQNFCDLARFSDKSRDVIEAF